MKAEIFDAAVAHTKLEPVTIQMARAHLVDGRSLSSIATEYNVTPQRVHKATHRILTVSASDPLDRLRFRLIEAIDDANDVSKVARAKLTKAINNVLLRRA